jgi:hypothetical protein
VTSERGCVSVCVCVCLCVSVCLWHVWCFDVGVLVGKATRRCERRGAWCIAMAVCVCVCSLIELR